MSRHHRHRARPRPPIARPNRQPRVLSIRNRHAQPLEVRSIEFRQRRRRRETTSLRVPDSRRGRRHTYNSLRRSPKRAPAHRPASLRLRQRVRVSWRPSGAQVPVRRSNSSAVAIALHLGGTLHIGETALAIRQVSHGMVCECGRYRAPAPLLVQYATSHKDPTVRQHCRGPHLTCVVHESDLRPALRRRVVDPRARERLVRSSLRPPINRACPSCRANNANSVRFLSRLVHLAPSSRRRIPDSLGPCAVCPGCRRRAPSRRRAPPPCSPQPRSHPARRDPMSPRSASASASGGGRSPRRPGGSLSSGVPAGRAGSVSTSTARHRHLRGVTATASDDGERDDHPAADLTTLPIRHCWFDRRSRRASGISPSRWR